LRRLVDLAAADLKIPLKIGIEADSFESILSLVKDNLGSTVLPAVSIQDELARGQLQASLLVKPEVMRSLILATPTNRPPVRGLAQISKAIKRELKRLETP
jgi:LysR family nitrogen assimilation transcriptional regulator